MRTLFVILTILILSAKSEIFACSCNHLGGFAISHQVSDLVVYGKVLEYDSFGTHGRPNEPSSMRFAVIEKFRGIESRDTITVFGDYGADCRHYISTFPLNTKWVLALHKFENDYEISICGEFCLPIKSKKATGQIFERGYSDAIITVSLAELKKIITSPVDYPIYKGYNEFTSNGDYWFYSDTMPKANYTMRELSPLLSNNLNVKISSMKADDNHLVIANLIIKKDNSILMKDVHCCSQVSEAEKIKYESEIETILKSQTSWSCGLVNGKKSNIMITIPIMLNNK